jgi:hypothetical protein
VEINLLMVLLALEEVVVALLENVRHQVVVV